MPDLFSPFIPEYIYNIHKYSLAHVILNYSKAVAGVYIIYLSHFFVVYIHRYCIGIVIYKSSPFSDEVGNPPAPIRASAVGRSCLERGGGQLVGQGLFMEQGSLIVPSNFKFRVRG